MSVPTTESIALSWQPAKSDYREVVLLCARKRRRVVLGVVVVLGLLALAIGVLAREPGDVGIGVGLLTYALILSLFVHFRAGAGFWKHDFLRTPTTAALSAAEGLELRSSQAKTTYAWSAFATCQETEHLLVLRLRRSGRRLGAFLVLPKRAFADPAELDRGRSLIRTCVAGGIRPT